MQSIALPIPADHPAYAGHFPGQPLLPGVVLLSEVLEALLAQPEWGDALGSAATLAQAKFLAPVRPGDTLVLQITPGPAGRLGFEVRCGARIVASGAFQAGAAPAAA